MDFKTLILVAAAGLFLAANGANLQADNSVTASPKVETTTRG
ncbi:MAG: hypothetical protein AAGK38_12575 [Pseudomonadota bacterium]